MSTIRAMAVSAELRAEIKKQTSVLDGLVKLFEDRTSHLSKEEQIAVAKDLCQNGSDRQTAEVAAVWYHRKYIQPQVLLPIEKV